MFADYLDSELGEKKNIGNELRYNCPFCSSNHDFKFYVKVADDSTDGLWHCKKCDDRGNPVSFVMKYANVNFKDALDLLELYNVFIDTAHIKPKDMNMTDEEYILLLIETMETPEETEAEVKLVPPPLPTGYKRLIDNLYNPEAYPFLLYANSRGFTLADIETHNIGYVTYSEIRTANGNILPLRDHLVILTHGDQGEYQYWNTRSIVPSHIKSINAPSQEGEYSKRTTVFNLNRAKRTPYIVINEGVPDALTVGESGVGTFGKQITAEQVKLILKDIREDQRIYILLDNDAVAQIVSIARKLYSQHKNTYVVLKKTDEDANDLGHDKIWDIIENNSVVADEVGLSLLLLTNIA